MRKMFSFAIFLISWFHVPTPCLIDFSAPNVIENQIQSNGQADQSRLAEILKRTGEYCKKLDKAAFDFVCLEEIEEKTNFERDIQRYLAQLANNSSSQIARLKIPKEKVSRKFVYDYQVIRKAKKTTEKRTLLEENGKKRKEKDAQLKTINFRFQNVLFAPLGILNESLQSHYEYRIIKEETLGGDRVVVLEANPKPGLKTSFLYGTIWVKEKDFAILKIQWNQEGIGNYSVFKKRAETYKAQPRITLISEFSEEKNGINFPSKFYIEEAYILKNGKMFIRSETSVTYRNFKFFSVEVNVDVR
jgi:hypothetical protein